MGKSDVYFINVNTLNRQDLSTFRHDLVFIESGNNSNLDSYLVYRLFLSIITLKTFHIVAVIQSQILNNRHFNTDFISALLSICTHKLASVVSLNNEINGWGFQKIIHTRKMMNAFMLFGENYVTHARSRLNLSSLVCAIHSEAQSCYPTHVRRGDLLKF